MRNRPAFDEPAKAARRLTYLAALRKEHVVALYLNARHQELLFETVSIGTLTASLIHPREVFAPALAARAASVLVAHNHPSGDATPSPEDCEITRRLCRAGELLGVPLLDHLIIAEEGWFSFRERGLLGPSKPM
jgi:DNA repair protein RadC